MSLIYQIFESILSLFLSFSLTKQNHSKKICQTCAGAQGNTHYSIQEGTALQEARSADY